MFIKGEIKSIEKKVKDILESEPSFKRGDLSRLVTKIMKKREALLAIANENSTPCYVLDMSELQHSIKSFKTAFSKQIPRLHIYYAMKSNPHEEILKEVIKHNYGIDVSSGMELERALQCKAEDIIFTGPGKTNAELQLAIDHADKVLVNIDSFSELKRLGLIAEKSKKRIRVGIRVFSKVHETWSKFGIPIERLKEFWLEAKKYTYINIQGIQFHMSFNTTTRAFTTMFKEVAHYLQKDFNQEERKNIKFIDFGGGYLSHQSKAFYPSATMRGKIIMSANKYFYEDTEFVDKYYIDEALPIETYALEIGAGIQKYLEPLLSCSYFCEPGRIISDNVMHILLQVLDTKTETSAILDGGTNFIGWNIYNSTYRPVVNLTRPAVTEIPYTLFGNLCTPKDIWSKYCYAAEIKEGDILVVPYVGGYTYAFAQDFIKPIPPVIIIP